MQSPQLNLVENETPQAQKSENPCPFALAAAKEIVGEREHPDREAVASDATLAALASFFRSGYF